MRKPLYTRWWFIAIVIILILAIIGSMMEEDPTTDDQDSSSEVSTEKNDTNKEKSQEADEETKEEEEEEEEATQGTPVERATAFIDDEFGKTNTDKERIVSIGESNDAFEIVLNGDDNLTTNLARTGIMSKSADIFEEVSKYEDITTNDISIGWMMPLIDQYGNASDQRVLNIRLSKETLSKINWDNFNYDNFEGIAETYFIHPALKSE